MGHILAECTSIARGARLWGIRQYRQIQTNVQDALRRFWLLAISIWDGSIKWGWFAVFLLGGVAMLSITEPAFSLALFALSGFSITSKLWHWEIQTFPMGRRTIQIGGTMLILLLSTLSFFWVKQIKGDNPWSHLPQAWTAMLFAADVQLEVISTEIHVPIPPDGWNILPVPSQEPPTPLSEPQPDITAMIVYPQEIALYLLNKSHAVVRNPSGLIALWNLDNLGNQPNPLQIPSYSGDAFIKPGQRLLPLPLAGHPNVKNQIKKGDRIFGFITVTCLNCEGTKIFWVYAVQGVGGWYAPCEKGKYPALNAISQHIREIAANADPYLAMIPTNRRITIEQTIP